MQGGVASRYLLAQTLRLRGGIIEGTVAAKKPKLEEATSDSAAVRRPAFECRWDELNPAQLGAAAVLGLDADSWPQWVRPKLLAAQPGEDDESRQDRSFYEAMDERWPECKNDWGWENVRHSALTRQTWNELGAAEKQAATLLGYTTEVWGSFHAENGRGDHGWFLSECSGKDLECWADGGRCRVFRCGHGCQPVRCPNFAMCGDESDGFMFKLKGRCLFCDMFLGEDLDILDAAAAEVADDCCICCERAAIVKLPQCTHRFCGPCVKTLLDPGCTDEIEDGVAPPSHLVPGGGPGDKGCPLCRSQTLPAAWARRRAAD